MEPTSIANSVTVLPTPGVGYSPHLSLLGQGDTVSLSLVWLPPQWSPLRFLFHVTSPCQGTPFFSSSSLAPGNPPTPAFSNAPTPTSCFQAGHGTWGSVCLSDTSTRVPKGHMEPNISRIKLLLPKPVSQHRLFLGYSCSRARLTSSLSHIHTGAAFRIPPGI